MELPIDAVFWRTSRGSVRKHRNPIFDPAVGVTLESLVVDMLHCIFLGILQRFISFAWWSMVERNALQVSASNEEELLSLTVHRLREELFAWYPQHRLGNPAFTELPDL